MVNDKKRDLKKLLLINAGVLAFAVIFVLFAMLLRKVTVPYVYCLTYSLARLYCPFCGGTRAMFALASFDIASAMKYNLFLIYLIAAYIFYDIQVAVKIFSGRDGAFVVSKWLKILTVCLGLAYFIGRNLLMIIFDFDPIGDLAPFWQGLMQKSF